MGGGEDAFIRSVLRSQGPVRSMRAVVAVAILLSIPLSGCLGGAVDEQGDEPSPEAWPRCEHPWPCGDEWPIGLDGPFELREKEHVRVDLSTGVTLDGAIWWPDVPPGTDVPVILWASPYEGQCRYSSVSGDPGGLFENCQAPPIETDLGDDLFGYLGTAGYAFALFNVRGTGLSSGCYTFYGPESRADLAELVGALAQLDGVNGRVGMWGISAMGGTQFMAAVEAPPSLKAIMPSGIITDFWLNRYTPQGAMRASDTPFSVGWPTFNSVVPPAGAFKRINAEYTSTVAPIVVGNAPQRLCPGAAENAAFAAKGQFTDDRDPEWWNARNLAPLLHQIEAAVFVQHGLYESGHAFQDDAIWDLIDAPKRMLIGPWGHELVVDDHLHDYPGGSTTKAVVLEWFDFWLRGIGEPPRVGIVDIKDTGGAGPAAPPDEQGTWFEASAWPPEGTQEVLYLTPEGLMTEPGGTTSFRSVTNDDGAPCGESADRSDSAGTRIVYMSKPVEHDALIAGNPMAYLELTSDQPGGLVAIDVYHVGPDGLCDDPVLVSWGGADLRHYDGTGNGKPFPTGTETGIRIDLVGRAHPVEAGDRLAVVVSGIGALGYLGPPYSPNLDLSGKSHVVLPLVEGSLGGQEPGAEYPPRPRVPGTSGVQA